MAWAMKDEWIDLAEGHHYVVFHNPDVLVLNEDGKTEPVEHHLVHHIKLRSCPTCGAVRGTAEDKPLDFAKTKTDTHALLNAHHGEMMRYKEQHPQVRIGHGPKA